MSSVAGRDGALFQCAAFGRDAAFSLSQCESRRPWLRSWAASDRRRPSRGSVKCGVPGAARTHARGWRNTAAAATKPAARRPRCADLAGGAPRPPARAPRSRSVTYLRARRARCCKPRCRPEYARSWARSVSRRVDRDHPSVKSTSARRPSETKEASNRPVRGAGTAPLGGGNPRTGHDGEPISNLIRGRRIIGRQVRDLALTKSPQLFPPCIRSRRDD